MTNIKVIAYLSKTAKHRVATKLAIAIYTRVTILCTTVLIYRPTKLLLKNLKQIASKKPSTRHLFLLRHLGTRTLLLLLYLRQSKVDLLPNLMLKIELAILKIKSKFIFLISHSSKHLTCYS
jgi:hypothetical protein